MAGNGTGARSLPFLFDTAREPSLDVACRHCVSKDPTIYDNKVLATNLGPHAGGNGTNSSVLLPTAPFCCGVCQFDGRQCARAAPPGAVKELMAMYETHFGFDFHAFTPGELFGRIQGRTLWFLGDSQTWHSYYAVECFLRDFAPDLVRRPATADPVLTALLSPVKWWIPVAPMCLHLQDSTRVCNVRINKEAEAVAVLTWLLGTEPAGGLSRDLLVLNFGLHYDKDTARLLQDLQHLHAFLVLHKAVLPTVIWRDVPVQHFATPKGEYEPDRLGQACRPLQAGLAIAPGKQRPRHLHGGSYNDAMAPAIHAMHDEGLLHVLLTWDASAPLWNTHQPGECTHWCSPSAYHVWLFLLNRLMAEEGLGNAV